jgi:hypothetical protein
VLNRGFAGMNVALLVRALSADTAG